MKALQYILGILIPPVGVFMTYGISTTLLINIALTVFGYVPGIIHALWAIQKHYEQVGQQSS